MCAMKEGSIKKYIPKDKEISSSVYYIVYVPDAFNNNLDTFTREFQKDTTKIIKKFYDFDEFNEYFEFMLAFMGKVIGLDIEEIQDHDLHNYNYTILDYSMDFIIKDNVASHYVYFFMQPYEIENNFE